MLPDKDLIPRASLDQIQSMLTAIVRRERFSDGPRGEMIESGVVTALLERRKEIREQKL